MDAGQRSQYLAALGIDVWVPRHGAPVPDIVVEPVREPVSEAGDPARAWPLERAVARGVATPEVPLSPDAEAQWASLRSEIMSCTRCPLHATRTQGVVGVGYRQADWLVIGEAPGARRTGAVNLLWGVPVSYWTPCCARLD